MIGIRELRGDLAAHVRRAAAGETTVVSIAGHPAAVLAPLAEHPLDPANGAATGDRRTHDTLMSSLIASGALVPPRRTDGKVPTAAMSVWGNVRLDRLLAEIR